MGEQKINNIIEKIICSPDEDPVWEHGMTILKGDYINLRIPKK
jgi:hypothetical protein